MKDLNTAFSVAVTRAVSRDKGNTIGLLAEKTLHSALKFYFCEDENCHEVKYKGFVADVYMDDGVRPHIVEIQTKQTFRLAKKLDAYGDEVDVTVVLPLFLNKNVVWINPEDGSMTSPHKTTKPKNKFHILREMYGIRDYITRSNVTVCALMLNATEYKLLDGFGKDKKRRATKYDIVPEELCDEMWFSEKEDLEIFRIEELGEFTVDEFAKAAKVTRSDAGYAVLTLDKLGMTEPCGTKGRKKLRRFL